MAAVDCQTCRGTRRVIEPERQATFMAQAFTIHAQSVACPDCSRCKAAGLRTHCITGETRITPCVLEMKQASDGEWWLTVVEGGVTGFEGMQASALLEPGLGPILGRVGGWYACAGTKGRWDTLLIPTAELERAALKLRLRA